MMAETAAQLRINGELLVSVPQSGVYETPVGRIGVELNVDRDSQTQEVILDCTESATLQGRRGKQQRVVNLGPNGIGSQQISPTDTLVIDLGHRIKPILTGRLEVHSSGGLADGYRTTKRWVAIQGIRQ